MNLSACPRKTNQLLAALPPHEWPAFAARLEWVALPQGRLLYGAGAQLQHVYFPATATLSLVASMQDGAAAEVAVVGREGLAGVCAFMGGPALSGAVVQTAGYGWRMLGNAIREQAMRSPAVMQPLLRYTQTLLAHMAQASACHRHHALEQQLCRWLLLHLDRRPDDELLVTHERIAVMLGVRREGVTKAAQTLQRAGLLHGRRGRLRVVDRGGLEGRSCECYAVVRRAYDRLHNEREPQPVASAGPAWPAHRRDPDPVAHQPGSARQPWPPAERHGAFAMAQGDLS